jgi:hypothetical protein
VRKAPLIALRFDIAATALAVMLLSACSGTNSGGDGGTTTVEGNRMAPVSIEQVLTFEDETPVFVRGTLYADADGMRLCEAIGESFPVQCLGNQISVVDLDQFSEYAGLLVGDGEVRTSEGEVDIVGYYSNGTLRVDPSAAAADAS